MANSHENWKWNGKVRCRYQAILGSVHATPRSFKRIVELTPIKQGSLWRKQWRHTPNMLVGYSRRKRDRKKGRNRKEEKNIPQIAANRIWNLLKWRQFNARLISKLIEPTSLFLQRSFNTFFFFFFLVLFFFFQCSRCHSFKFVMIKVR